MLTVSLLAQTTAEPYESQQQGRMETMSLMASVASLYLGLLFTLGELGSVGEATALVFLVVVNLAFVLYVAWQLTRRAATFVKLRRRRHSSVQGWSPPPTSNGEFARGAGAHGGVVPPLPAKHSTLSATQVHVGHVGSVDGEPSQPVAIDVAPQARSGSGQSLVAVNPMMPSPSVPAKSSNTAAGPAMLDEAAFRAWRIQQQQPREQPQPPQQEQAKVASASDHKVHAGRPLESRSTSGRSAAPSASGQSDGSTN